MRKIFVILAVALALLVTLRDDARAQSPALDVGSPRSFNVGGSIFSVGGDLAFSVKFLCGTIPPGPGLPLAAGTYLTAINIHNLGGSVTHITYALNGALKSSFFLPPGVVSLDCRDIMTNGEPGSPGNFVPSDPFSEGFVTLSAVEAKGRLLNVVPVYTVATVPK